MSTLFTGGGDHHMQVQVYSGLDAFIMPLLPRGMKVRRVAAKIRRHHKLESVPPGAFTFTLPGETLVYEVTDTGARPFRLRAA